MFRIRNQNNITDYKQKNGFGGFRKIFINKNFAKLLALLALAALGYGIWTHGTFTLSGREEAKLAAQVKSPLPPEWLERYFGKDVCYRENYCGPDADPDSDNFSNYEEFLFFTNPTNPDTDGDGASDGEEVKTNFTNPLGTGSTPAPRDINEIAEYNPFADALVAEGLKEIEAGNILTAEQIVEAASNLTELPNFGEVPFRLIDDDSQDAISKYSDLVSQVTDEYRNKPVVSQGVEVLDTTDLDALQQFIDATEIYAVSLVAIETPYAVFDFHKSLLGSVVFNGLLATAQKDFLQSVVSEDELRDRTQSYIIYHTRYMQELARAGQKVKQKYTFAFVFEEQSSTP